MTERRTIPCERCGGEGRIVVEPTWGQTKQSLSATNTEICPTCNGLGLVVAEAEPPGETRTTTYRAGEGEEAT